MTTIDRTGCTATRHGDDNAYSSAHCRCPDAREAWRTYSYNKRHGTHQARLINPTPTAHRLRILAGIGYDWRTLARHLGCTPRSVTELAYLTRKRVQRTTAHRIRDLYNQLITQPSPDGYPALRAIGNAQRNGWGVIDLEAVHRALTGSHKPPLTPLERKAVIFTGLARGMPTTTIATAAGTNNRAITAAAQAA